MPGDRGTHVDGAERGRGLLEQPVGVRLDREVGLGDRHAAELVRDSARARSSPRLKWTRTRAPSAANARAHAAPIPPDAPVTTHALALKPASRSA